MMRDILDLVLSTMVTTTRFPQKKFQAIFLLKVIVSPKGLTISTDNIVHAHNSRNVVVIDFKYALKGFSTGSFVTLLP